MYEAGSTICGTENRVSAEDELVAKWADMIILTGKLEMQNNAKVAEAYNAIGKKHMRGVMKSSGYESFFKVCLCHLVKR